MSKIKKLLFALMFLVLILPIGANAACICDPLGIFCIPPFCNGGGGGGGGEGFNLDNISGMGLPGEGGSILGIIENVAMWLLGVFAFFGVIGFVVSGIMYLVSAGDDDMISKAKKYMLYSMVGVIVGLMGLVIIQAAFYMLGGSSF